MQSNLPWVVLAFSPARNYVAIVRRLSSTVLFTLNSKSRTCIDIVTANRDRSDGLPFPRITLTLNVKDVSWKLLHLERGNIERPKR